MALKVPGMMTISTALEKAPLHVSRHLPDAERGSTSAINEPEYLSGLTSLRFFAAALIVFYHSYVHLGEACSAFVTNRLGLTQGVSFFFVLSGFILTRVYPVLKTERDVRQFFVARFARIWPVHMLCLVVSFILMGLTFKAHDLLKAIASCTLVQDWMLDAKTCLYINHPAWSLSAEALFYGCFPVLLRGVSKRPLMVVTIAYALLVTALLLIPAHLNMPDSLVPRGEMPYDFFYFHPIARIFEFITGMSLAVLLKQQRVFSFVRKHGRILTILSLMLVAAGLFSPACLQRFEGTFAWRYLHWITFTGGVIPYALLIAVVAVYSGALSRFLSNKHLVRLGNVSFAIYLLHTSLAYVFLWPFTNCFGLPHWLSFILYCLVLLASADLIYAAFETPVRSFIVDRFKGKPWCPPRLTKVAVAEMCFLLATWGAFAGYDASLKVAELNATIHSSPPPLIGARFGDEFKLIGIRLVHSVNADGATLCLAWKRLRQSHTSFTNAVHLIDAKNRLIHALDFSMDSYPPNWWSPDVTLAKVLIPKADLNRSVAVGIGIFPMSRYDLLPVDRGPRGYDGKRLDIPLSLFQTAVH